MGNFQHFEHVSVFILLFSYAHFPTSKGPVPNSHPQNTVTIPLFAKSLAVSFPIPVLAPVINTVLPCNRALLLHTPPAKYHFRAAKLQPGINMSFYYRF